MIREGAADRPVGVELAWCPACRADCFVEVVVLAGDPGPVGVCGECGLGLDLPWWSQPAGQIRPMPPRVAQAS